MLRSAASLVFFFLVFPGVYVAESSKTDGSSTSYESTNADNPTQLLIISLAQTISGTDTVVFSDLNNYRVMNENQEEVIKCLTPYLLLFEEYRGQLDPEVVHKIDEWLHTNMQDSQDFISESGKFRINYFTDGEHAVPKLDADGSGIPDYVESAAEFADESWAKQVEELGFEDPVADAPIEIRIRNIGPQSYGYTLTFDETTRIYVHNTFTDFPQNDDPDGHQMGALKATIAHELKHSIQFVTSRAYYQRTSSSPWIEMDATMMENIVYPQVNDYYHYISETSGIFGNPRQSTPVAYNHVTWSLFYAEFLGMDFWVDTWRVIRDESPISMTNAMKRALHEDPEQADDNFRELLARNYLWHAASGSRAIPGYGFSESKAYPDAFMEQRHQPVPFDYADSGSLSKLSGTYRMFYPSAGQIGPISLSTEHSHNHFSVGVLGYRSDGTIAEWALTASDSNQTTGDTPFGAAELDSFIVVIANAHPNAQVTYNLEIEILSIPDVATLENNYPNPFFASSMRPGTTIVFSTPETGRVSITVYDITGREVARLFDRDVEPGRYSVPFTADGLASGIYIYRMRAGDVQETQKMTLVR